MNTSSDLRGVLPVFQTPFREDYSIDFDVLRHEVEWLYECGADGIVMAMVSETLRLSTEERRELAAAACKFGCQRGAVVISVGAESTFVAESLARHAESVGATAVMAIPPVSVAVGEDELLRYYEAILRGIRIPLIVQDASGYVGKPMSIEIQARLLNEFGNDRILFKPEATPIGPRLTALHHATGGRARVFEGSGGIALTESFRRGITGTMPGADLIKGIVALWHALEAGDEERVYELSFPISALVAMQHGLDGFIAVEKYLLHKQGVFPNTVVRGPVGFVLDDETKNEIDRLFSILEKSLQSSR